MLAYTTIAIAKAGACSSGAAAGETAQTKMHLPATLMVRCERAESAASLEPRTHPVATSRVVRGSRFGLASLAPHHSHLTMRGVGVVSAGRALIRVEVNAVAG